MINLTNGFKNFPIEFHLKYTTNFKIFSEKI